MNALLLAALLAVVPGERLSYEVRLGPLGLGTLVLAVLKPDTAGADTCTRFRADLELKLGFLFQGRYRLDSWSRQTDLVTLRSAKDTEETRYRSSWTCEYDYEAGFARYSDGDSFPLTDRSHDLLTLWYLFRDRPLDPGDTVRVTCHSDRRTQRVTVTAAPGGRVTVPAGTFDCVELRPAAAGPLGRVWLARDSARTPVKIGLRTGSLEVDALLARIEMEAE